MVRAPSKNRFLSPLANELETNGDRWTPSQPRDSYHQQESSIDQYKFRSPSNVIESSKSEAFVAGGEPSGRDMHSAHQRLMKGSTRFNV